MPEPLFDLACAACAEPYPETGLPEVCPRCGGCWRYGDGFAWRPASAMIAASAASGASGTGADAAPGLRRWAPALGLDPEDLPARSLGCPPGLYAPGDGGGEVWICQQGSAPAGSYKERGAEVMAAAAHRRGVPEIFLDSSGNAGIAVARAAAARGIRCTVLVPATTPAIKIERIRDAGAQVEVVPGNRDATHAAAQQWRRKLPYAAPFFQPSFLAGTATLAWELAAAIGTPLPADWLLPAGNGPLLLGLALGLGALVRAGVIDRLPALHAVQLEGYAALAPDGPGEARPGAPTAAGIAIGRPPRRADMQRAVASTGGDVTRVSEDEIAAARRELADHGWTADPTGAAAFAGYRRRSDLRAPAAAGDEGGAPPRCLVIVTSREARLS
ncbi:MAG: pyridoxal-phosphate dependent enzyme [Acidobacteria bacterium]|nr:pyridoxal-phosphate dependent enzyme [Acidobacteriota bacterium]